MALALFCGSSLSVDIEEFIKKVSHTPPEMRFLIKHLDEDDRLEYWLDNGRDFYWARIFLESAPGNPDALVSFAVVSLHIWKTREIIVAIYHPFEKPAIYQSKEEDKEIFRALLPYPIWTNVPGFVEKPFVQGGPVQWNGKTWIDYRAKCRIYVMEEEDMGTRPGEYQVRVRKDRKAMSEIVWTSDGHVQLASFMLPGRSRARKMPKLPESYIEVLDGMMSTFKETGLYEFPVDVRFREPIDEVKSRLVPTPEKLKKWWDDWYKVLSSPSPELDG